MTVNVHDLHSGYIVEVLVNDEVKFSSQQEHPSDVYDVRQVSGSFKLLLEPDDKVVVKITPLEPLGDVFGSGQFVQKKAKYQALKEGSVLSVERTRVY